MGGSSEEDGFEDGEVEAEFDGLGDEGDGFRPVGGRLVVEILSVDGDLTG